MFKKKKKKKQSALHPFFFKFSPVRGFFCAWMVCARRWGGDSQHVNLTASHYPIQHNVKTTSSPPLRPPLFSTLLWVFLFLLVVITITPVRADDISELRLSLVRKGVTSARVSSKGCVSVNIGGRDMGLEISQMGNDFILFEDNGRTYAQGSTTYDYSHQTDIVTLGSLQNEQRLIFWDTKTSVCDGYLPLGPLSSLWGYFDHITLSQYYIHFGLGPLQGAVKANYITLMGVGMELEGNLEVFLDPTEKHIQIPLPYYMAREGTGFQTPFLLPLPPYLYETNADDGTVILGRAFYQQAAVTMSRATFNPILYVLPQGSVLNEQQTNWTIIDGYGSSDDNGDESDDFVDTEVLLRKRSFMMDPVDDDDVEESAAVIPPPSILRTRRSVYNSGSGGHWNQSGGDESYSNWTASALNKEIWIYPFKCASLSTGEVLFRRLLGFMILVVEICWVFNEVGEWLLKSKGQPITYQPSDTEFFPSQWIGSTEETEYSTSGIEWPLTWLFLLTLIFWNAGSLMIKDNKVFCLLCRVTWECPTNPYLPTGVISVSQLIMILHIPVLAVICIGLIAWLRVWPKKTGCVLIPVMQLGFAANWALLAPITGDGIEITAWNIMMIMWIWIVVWEGLCLSSRGGKTGFLACTLVLMDALILVGSATMTVFVPTFRFYGPAESSLATVWIIFFAFLLSVVPPAMIYASLLNRNLTGSDQNVNKNTKPKMDPEVHSSSKVVTVASRDVDGTSSSSSSRSQPRHRSLAGGGAGNHLLSSLHGGSGGGGGSRTTTTTNTVITKDARHFPTS